MIGVLVEVIGARLSFDMWKSCTLITTRGSAFSTDLRTLSHIELRIIFSSLRLRGIRYYCLILCDNTIPPSTLQSITILYWTFSCMVYLIKIWDLCIIQHRGRLAFLQKQKPCLILCWTLAPSLACWAWGL